MGPHLSDETLMDALEGAPGGATAQHLSSCAACSGRLAEAREGLAMAAGADVPEPPGMYWQSFPRQVARRLDAAPASRAWRGWLVPGLATAVGLAAAIVLLPRPSPEPGPQPVRTLAAWSALPPADEDPSLPVLQALGPELEPALECAGVADCLADLSEEESQDLVRTLRPEIKEWSLL